jgi:hypothetical protein
LRKGTYRPSLASEPDVAPLAGLKNLAGESVARDR